MDWKKLHSKAKYFVWILFFVLASLLMSIVVFYMH